MTPKTTHDNAVGDAIAEIRRITAVDNSDQFSSDALLDACIRLVQADDAAHEDADKRALGNNVNFLAALDAARYRADSYDDSERTTITRAITRANRSLANR